MTILILGPSQWLPSKQPPSLEVLWGHLPASRAPVSGRPPAPLDVRIALAEILSQRGVSAIVMEAEEPKDPPNSTVKFHELVEKHFVEDYYIYWPYGAARPGLDVELGFLLEQMWRRELCKQAGPGPMGGADTSRSQLSRQPAARSNRVLRPLPIPGHKPNTASYAITVRVPLPR